METVREALEMLQAGQPEAAEGICVQILATASARAERADALHLLALLALEAERDGDAIGLLTQAVAHDPDNLQRRFDLARLLIDTDETEHALAELALLLERSPAHPDLLLAQGEALRRANRHADAVCSLEALVEGSPEAADAWAALATAYLDWGRGEAAAKGFEHALSLRPADPALLLNLGAARLRAGAPREALEVFSQLTCLQPEEPRAWMNAGIAMKALGDTEGALEAQQQAIRFAPEDPDAQWNLALTELQLGQSREGFARYEWRRRLPGFPPDAREPWDGGELEGRPLAIRAEQGLGDTIAFLRFIPRLRSLSERVSLEVQPALVPLLERCAGLGLPIGPLGEGDPQALWAPLMSLPHLLGDAGSLAIDAAYLRPDPAIRPASMRRIEEAAGLRVGLCWQGNPSYRDDAHRSIALARLEPLLELPKVSFFGLQKHHGREQLDDPSLAGRVEDLGAALDESGGAFVETATILAGLDLLITTDTAMVHLAGALGARTWLLLPRIADWRWGEPGAEPTWYPSVRIFRQQAQGEWEPVITELREALERLAAQERPGR